MEGYIFNMVENKYFLAPGEGTTAIKEFAFIYTKDQFNYMFSDPDEVIFVPKKG